MSERTDLRLRLDCLTETTDGERLTGPWHPEESGDRAAYGWWLDDDAGNSTFPDPGDVAAFLNALPRLLAIEEAARAVLYEWTQTIADGGLVTIALADPIAALRGALSGSVLLTSEEN